jgi:hypothetical protein
VLPGLETLVTETGWDVPPPARADLARRGAGAFVQTTRSIRAGSAALRKLERHGIPCAAFKGLAALSYLYPSPRHRLLQDVDVLIRPADTDASLQLLEEEGFRRGSGGSQDTWSDYLAFIRHSPGYAGNEAVSLTDPQGGVIDLHWRLGEIDTTTLLADVRRIRVFHSEIPVVSPAYGLLLTVHHVLRNDFVPDDVARDITDFGRWQDLLTTIASPPSQSPQMEEWDRFHEAAQRWGLLGASVAMAKIVAGLSDHDRVLLPIKASPADRRTADHLAALYFHQLQDGALNTDLAYLASHRPWLTILSGALTGWTRYRASMQEAERLNGEISQPLSSRLWSLAKAASRLSPSRWQMVRSLARVKNHLSKN